jgi:hypothetical protein
MFVRIAYQDYSNQSQFIDPGLCLLNCNHRGSIVKPERRKAVQQHLARAFCHLY